MKTQLIKVLPKVALLSIMLILTSVASAQAQSLSYRPRFAIPFDFQFGETKLPAGKYSVGRAGSSDTMLSIADRAGRSKAIVLSTALVRSDAVTRATLVFHRYGDQYFLVQVWAAGSESGRRVPESKSERALQKQLASSGSGSKVAANTKREVVTIDAAMQ
jgi:hypothetical protein